MMNTIGYISMKNVNRSTQNECVPVVNRHSITVQKGTKDYHYISISRPQQIKSDLGICMIIFIPTLYVRNITRICHAFFSLHADEIYCFCGS